MQRLSFPTQLACLMGAFAVWFICFGPTTGPNGTLVAKGRPVFEMLPMIFAGVFGCLWGYLSGRLVSAAIKKWPNLTYLALPPAAVKRTLVSYGIVFLVVLLLNFLSANWLGLFSACAMFGGVSLFFAEAWRVNNVV